VELELEFLRVTLMFELLKLHVGVRIFLYCMLKFYVYAKASNSLENDRTWSQIVLHKW